MFATERTHGNDAIHHAMSFSATFQVIKPSATKDVGNSFGFSMFVCSLRSEVFSLVLAWAFMCFLE